MSDKSVTVELTATSSAFVNETTKAANVTKSLSQEAKTCGVTLASSFQQGQAESGKATKKMGEDVDSYKKKLEELKAVGGRRSAFGETLELLKGGGAIGGISILTEEIKKSVETASKLNEEFRQGKIDGMGLAVGIGESLPIIGAFVTAGQAIREAFTHEKEQIENINEEIKTGNELMEQRVKTQEDVKKGEEEIAEKIRKANQELALANAKTPEEREKLEAQFKGDDNKHEDKTGLDEMSKKRQEDLNKELEDIRKNGEARKKVAEDDAHNNLSFYDKTSYNDGAMKDAEDAKRIADAQVDNAVQKALKGAQERAKNDIAEYKKGMDEQARIRDAAIAKELENKQTDKKVKEIKGDEKKLGEFGSTIFEFGKKAADTIGKAVDKKIDEGVKKAEEKNKQTDELKAERDALKAGKDPEAARLEKENPAAAKLKEEIDELNKRNQLLKEAETPMDKYKASIAEAGTLLAKGLITQAQYKEVWDKAHSDLKDAEKKDDKQQSKVDEAKITGERRFSFDIQGNKGKDNKEQIAKDHLAVAKQSGTWLQQLKQKIVDEATKLVSLDAAGA